MKRNEFEAVEWMLMIMVSGFAVWMAAVGIAEIIHGPPTRVDCSTACTSTAETVP